MMRHTNKHWAGLLLATGMSAAVGFACSSNSCGEGTEPDSEGYCRPVQGASSSSSGGVAVTDMGDLGGACYPNSTCNLGLECMGSRCQPAADRRGEQGFGCYPNNTCNLGLACVSGTCVPDTGGMDAGSVVNIIPAGSEGGDCYGNNTCDLGLYCVAGGCTSAAPQGTLNGACYPNNSCDEGYECSAGRCVTEMPATTSSSSSSSSGGSSGSSSSSGGSGSSSSSSGGGQTARAYFDANVVAPLQMYCAACHESNRSGPDFQGTGTGQYYDKAVAYAGGKFIRPNPSQNSDLVLKGLHAGPAFRSDGNPSDRQKVITWLEMEAEERGLNNTGSSSSSGGMGSSSSGGGTMEGPPLTASQAIQWFANCISRTDFDANAEGTQTSFKDVANQNSTEGRCYSCHATGAGGAYLSTNADDTYYFNKRTPYVLKIALPSQDTQGNYTMVNANRFRDHGLEPGTHPRYTLNAARQAAVDQLYARTLLRFQNNTDNCRAGMTP